MYHIHAKYIRLSEINRPSDNLRLQTQQHCAEQLDTTEERGAGLARKAVVQFLRIYSYYLWYYLGKDIIFLWPFKVVLDFIPASIGKWADWATDYHRAAILIWAAVGSISIAGQTTHDKSPEVLRNLVDIPLKKAAHLVERRRGWQKFPLITRRGFRRDEQEQHEAEIEILLLEAAR